jgi:outer membrane lipoprotein-sorting protein
MKRKISILGIITIMVLVMASLVGCSKASTTTTTKTASASTSVQTTTASSTSTSTGNGLTDLLGKAASVSYYYCEVNMTSGAGTSNMKEWIKTGNPAKIRMEVAAAGQTTDIIYDGQNYYMYMPSANIAYQMSVAAAQQYTANSGNTSSLTQYNPVLVGPDTVNGMACTVYQYTVQGVSTKIWIWNQYGLPVQMVSGTTTIVYSNYSFSAIADSEFQLPAGVTVTTMPVIPTTTP